MGGGQAAERGVARLLALCAVLCGLFLMHGAPASAAGGCHGGMPVMSASSIGVHHGAATDAVHAGAATLLRPDFQVGEVGGTHGELCVSTPAHERFPVPGPRLLAVAEGAVPAAWAAAPPRAAMGRAAWRGPPPGGRDLLLQVCVART
ncbi:hypothetical protein OIB37_27725 [Streptomyces sp. NBC_00820]|uniref:hypothetical protein n=1 Tax=Streptomyces sp. NBC_00820 TaxID=2975842 RepID=UPI002ED2C228|nr:hypothetical protein OIB37_27725 [Streptomyces sp. NBC_00820]